MRCRLILSTALWLVLMASPGLADSKAKPNAKTNDQPVESDMVASDGVKIHYYILGKGTPVILIHGYTGSAYGNWFLNGIAQALAKNHMVVALDCRNHGKS